jgi:hypothetical protein
MHTSQSYFNYTIKIKSWDEIKNGGWNSIPTPTNP